MHIQYACESWTLRKQDRCKLMAFEMLQASPAHQMATEDIKSGGMEKSEMQAQRPPDSDGKKAELLWTRLQNEKPTANNKSYFAW